MTAIDRPNPDDVTGVLLAVKTEVLVHDGVPELWALRVLKDYFRNISDVVGEDAVWIAEEVEQSEYDRDLRCWAGEAFVEVEPDQWRRIAEGFQIDLEDDGILPPDRDLIPTLGTLTASGVIPAVCIEGTDEGWESSSYEPDVLASFFVSLRVRGDAD